MSDDDNVWEQPSAPPPPLFTGKKEKDLVKQVTDELTERVVKSEVVYYPISLKHSNYHSLYGEAVDKSFLSPVHISAYVEWQGTETVATNLGVDKKSTIVVHFHKRRLTEDKNLFVREGDFVLYGKHNYEIVSLGQPRPLFGQIDSQIEIVATCVKARDGVIPEQKPIASNIDDDPRLTAPACDPLTELRVLDGTGTDTGGSGGTPTVCDEVSKRPLNPPPPLFTGTNESNLVKQISDEVLERVIGQQVVYFPVSVKHSNFHSLYGESVNKTFLPPVRVYAAVDWQGSETTSENYGVDKVSKVTVRFHKRRLTEDQNLFVRVGDFVLYGTVLYEITKTGQPRQLFGQVGQKFEIVAECIKAREGVFKLSPQKQDGSLVDVSSIDPCENATFVNIGEGEKNTGANIGTGEGIFAAKVGKALQFKSIVAGDNIVLNSSSTEIMISSSAELSGTISNAQTASFAHSALIGSAEDGTYTDGLFTSFITSTPVGTAVDKFNEILKILVPSPAPDVSRINASTGAGVSTKLSFGSGNTISGYTNVSAVGSFAAVNVSGTYESATSGNDFRRGTYDGTTTVEGIVNFHVPADTYDNAVNNYPVDSFGNAETGSLELYLNDTLLHSIELTSSTIGAGNPGSGTGTHVNSDGSGFINVSVTASSEDRSQNKFDIFQHRTANYRVHTSDQASGLNYVVVKHSGSWGYKTTNHAQWVNDPNSNALTATNARFANESGTGSKYLSGVQYFKSGSANYLVDVNNAYKNVYTSQNISFTATSCSISTQSFPDLNTGSGEDETKVLRITGSATCTTSVSLSGSITASVNVAHPLKSDLSSAGSATSTGFLIYDVAGTSTALRELFKIETYRLVSGSYDNQSDIDSGGWNSETHMTGSGTHSDGLQFYNARLYSPTKTIQSGDFRDNSEDGPFGIAPAGNPNYSGETGLRTFYRYFRNSTGATKRDIVLTTSGSSTTIVPADTALSSGRVRVFVKIPGSTGWMDVAEAFSYDTTTDHAGAYVLSFDNTVDATNYMSFGTKGVANGEDIAIKVEANTSWTGYLNDIVVSFGAGVGSAPSEAPQLDDIDINDAGASVKLSFGSSKAITGYANVSTSTGNSAVDINGAFTDSGDIAGVFNGSTVIDGELNEDVSSSGTSYVANSFNNAATGSLRLEVNGVVVHTIDLSSASVGAGNPGSGSDTELNGNSSGFTNLSTYKPGTYSTNSIPDWTKLYRTGKFQVGTADQQNGWNYVRVLHSGSEIGQVTTNYVEWANDNNSDALAASATVLDSFSGSATGFYMSGVQYFTACTSSFRYAATNVYKNVYYRSSDGISFPTTTQTTVSNITTNGPGLASPGTTSGTTKTLPSLSTSTNSQNHALYVTGTISFDPSESLVGAYATTSHTASVNGRVKHPLKSNLTTSTLSQHSFLVFSGSENGDLNSNEYFDGEEYRLQSGSYASQASVTNAGNVWASTASINDAGTYPNYANGLLLYNDYLLSPKKGGLSGDFRSVGSGGSLQAPPNNPNYSSVSTPTREYYRYFQSSQVGDVSLATVTLFGDANLVAKGGAFNTGTPGNNKNIHVEVKIPGDTGWLDMARPASVSEDIEKDVGGFNGGGGDVNQTIDTDGTSYGINFRTETLNGTSGGTADYLIVRITAHENWTGYLTRINFTYGS